ncbi:MULTISPECIES: class I SAM-dependent methyltransferase [unclassified Rathayibacter]|uniref:class I SAM-dependent methyltransferase n=1 Tax=unclassified Rathayibacter TaxID=2609250 RepID=UPI00188B9E41|nr:MULTISPECIES: class I SAM-dependent methyltransferase [unclassified Rathayibacter]MBF4461819.1 class I SAM-dependent methyltransferase [Rathayibacter sp. VKM Ac-2879]MBF4503232.1 class I SAM-dependent methyltransferase [Rathayibacter sp. VKM Ac-2878]
MNDWARAFGRAVDAYDRGRPGYPDEAVDWLVAHTPQRDGASSAPQRVADLGAGTGKFTASLVARRLDVTAVEPDPAMLARLGEHLPSVRRVAGSAEALPLADASVELVTAAQSWHWVDAERAGAEVARVLVPEGILALVWNIRDESVPWVRQLGDVAGVSTAERFETVRPPLGSALETLAYAEFGWSFELDRAGVRDMFASRSYVIAMAAPEREAVLAAVDRVLAAEFDEQERVAMPYSTRVTLARRSRRA